MYATILLLVLYGGYVCRNNPVIMADQQVYRNLETFADDVVADVKDGSDEITGKDLMQPHEDTDLLVNNYNDHDSNSSSTSNGSLVKDNTKNGDKTEKDEEVEDERSMLDCFGEIAKVLLTQHMIPKTNSNCKWNWYNLRCEDYCQCHFHFKFGDYHLGRSCRQRPQPQQKQEVEEFENDKRLKLLMCHVPPDTPYTRFIDTIKTHLHTLRSKVFSHSSA